MNSIIAGFFCAASISSLAFSARSEVAPQPAAEPAVVAGLAVHKTVYGDAFADHSGMTLYVSDEDSKGKSACDGACADTWVPVPAPRIAKGLGDWTIATRADGNQQWAYRGQPLYSFAGDQAPGDVNGEGLQGRWHAAMSARAFQPPGVVIRRTDFGPTFETADGHVLYMPINFFYNAGTVGTTRHQKSPDVSACSGDCLKPWTPLEAPAGSTASGDWSVIEPADGKHQWAWKSHPLYTYLQETKVGDTSGEGHWIYTGIRAIHWEAANIVP
jgi:predicted lipoprotein with Yx(FWY)xxD motif